MSLSETEIELQKQLGIATRTIRRQETALRALRQMVNEMKDEVRDARREVDLMQREALTMRTT